MTGFIDEAISTTDSTDYNVLAAKIEAHKAKEAKSKNDGYVKMTIYVREDVAKSFNALCTERGQQREFTNEAFRDFIKKKAKEMGIEF